jgi:hypothetical protein
MTADPIRVESEPRALTYTHLFASISEEDDGYVVQVRLYNEPSLKDAAWGEEIANSLETASALISALAAEFSIPPERIKLELRMANLMETTQH